MPLRPGVWISAAARALALALTAFSSVNNSTELSASPDQGDSLRVVSILRLAIAVSVRSTRARVLKPTFGVLIQGVCAEKENINLSKEVESIEKLVIEKMIYIPDCK